MSDIFKIIMNNMADNSIFTNQGMNKNEVLFLICIKLISLATTAVRL